MQTASPRIWTRVTESIPNDDIRYSTSVNPVRGPCTSPNNLTHVVLSFSAGSDRVYESYTSQQWKKKAKRKNLNKRCLTNKENMRHFVKLQCVESLI